MQLILQEEYISLTARLPVCKHTSFALQGLHQLQRGSFLRLPPWRWLASTDRGSIKASSLQLYPGGNSPEGPFQLKLLIGSAEVVPGAWTIVGPLSKSSFTPHAPYHQCWCQEYSFINILYPTPSLSSDTASQWTQPTIIAQVDRSHQTTQLW